MMLILAALLGLFAPSIHAAPPDSFVTVVRVKAAAANNLTGANPLLAPLIVNLDEGATSNFSASWTPETSDAKGLVLPHGSNRALVFEKRQVGTSDYTDGQAAIRIIYSVK